MIQSIGHIALNAHHFPETLEFYTQVLQFPVMFELQNDAGELWIVYLKISDTVFLELFPQSGEAPTKDGHFSHFCLEVDDLEATVAQMTQRGAVLTSPIKRGKDGNLQAWTCDPEGNRIELMQLAPDSLQKQAIARLREL